MNTPEPFRIKMVEPIKKTTKDYRKNILKKAFYNLFLIKSKDIYIDLLTDSGTGSMSDKQWSHLMLGDESYAGSKSYYKLKKTIKKIFNYNYTIPCHQGRAAENLLFPILYKDKKNKFTKRPCFISNYHFDTTAAHVQLSDCDPINVICDESKDILNYHPFKGNFDIKKLEKEIIIRENNNVVGIILTITCNSVGGQPVSMDNIKKTSLISKKYNIPLIIDCARFCENAYFIKSREPKYKNTSIQNIVLEMFSFGDVMLMSSKKDALVNIGGLCCIKNDKILFKKVCERCIPFEGFITYGGLAGRDIEALTIGLEEGMDENYLTYRINQIEYLGEQLKKLNIPIQYPVGGHAVFIDAKSLLPHIPPEEFPAQVLANELYLEGGIRSVEIGSFLLGRDLKTNKQIKSDYEFLRLTIPRRVYTNSHMDYIVEIFKKIIPNLKNLRGLEIIYEPPILRHFTANLKPKPKKKNFFFRK